MNACRLCRSIGLPATQRNCFSSSPDVRVEDPAATMMTPTSRAMASVEQVAEQVAHVLHRYDAPPRRRSIATRRAALGHEDARHPHVPRFGDAALHLRDGPDLAAESE